MTESARAYLARQAELVGAHGFIDRARVQVTPDGRLDTDNAATFLGVSKKTLANWRYRRIGPCWRKVGSMVFYELPDLEKFVSGDRGKAA
jgi:hypothetical protein